MAYKGLSTMVKTVIAAVVAGGIFIAGIAWQGEGSVRNIKDDVYSLKSKLIQAVADNEWLQGQFKSLSTVYNQTVDEANGTIEELSRKKAELEARVAGLSAQLQMKEAQLQELLTQHLADERQLNVAQAELQSEIDRLEGELDQANIQIADLEAFAEEANKIEYTPLNREDYQVIVREIKEADGFVPEEGGEDLETSGFVSTEAMTQNPALALLMEANAKAMEAALGVEIDGVVALSGGQLAYQVHSIPGTALKDINTKASEEVLHVKDFITAGNLYFVDNEGTITYIKHNGQYKA